MVITGSMLRKLRIEAGLTQKELAELAGVSQAHIAKIESGKVDPRLSTVNKILKILTERAGLKCSDIMTRDVIYARPEDTIEEISKLMVKHAISQLPIIDKDGKVVGTITEKTIIKNLSQNIAKEKVKNIMEPPLPCVPENTSVNTIRILLENHIGVLVTKNGEIVGIITRSDILKTICKPL